MLPTDISRRNFLAKTGVVLTGLFLFSVKRTWAVCSGRQDCRACGARIKPEVADGVVCCPNCGREWQTGGFALKDAFEYRFPRRLPRHPRLHWDYTQVPFPNFELLVKSDKPVLSFKQISVSGRRTA